MTTVYLTSYSYNRTNNPHDHTARAQLESAPPERPPDLTLTCMHWQPPSGLDCQRYSGVNPQIQNHVRMLPNAMEDMYVYLLRSSLL
jgi:hypothetical protein